MRKDFVKALEPLVAADPRAIFFSGDLGFQAFEELSARLGPRFVNAGVAEQNMIGVAAGVALAGMNAWVYSIAPFATFRCLEQIRNDVCLHDLPVRVVGNGGGYTYGMMGSTHHALEDLAALKALPNMELFFPCTNSHVAAAVDVMHRLGGPAYLRLAISGFASDAAPLSENPATLTRLYQRRKSERGITIVGAGHAVQIVLTARGGALGEADADIFGVARHPLRLDEDTELAESIAATGRVLFVEEHYASGGIGESFLRESVGRVRGGIRDFRLLAPSHRPDHKVGSAAFLLRQAGMTPERVTEVATTMLAGAE